ACSSDSGKNSKKDTGFPGYDPPPLDQLVREATAKGPPKGDATPYVTPPSITVPPLRKVDASSLPKDEKGRPILNETLGVRLVYDAKLHDPITAMGACVDLATACVQPPSTSNRRTEDACWASTPKCATNRPWAEGKDCCPARCQDLYTRLRKL